MSEVLNHVYDWLAVLNLTVVTIFIAIFAREPWRRSAFGQSVMTLAVAVWLFSLLGVLLTVLGEDYRFREEIRTVGRLLVFAAMVQRLIVLVRARRADR